MDGCVTLMRMKDESFDGKVTKYPALMNIGCGVDLTLWPKALQQTAVFTDALIFDTSKADGTLRNLRREVGSLKHSAMQENAKRS